MKIAINDQWAALVVDDTLIQNAEKTYIAEFVFDESWDGFSKTAIFEAGPASIIVVLTEDRCVIPAECLKRGGVKLRIGVYGTKGGEQKGTVWCSTSMILYAANMDAGQSVPSTPLPDDAYVQIMAAIGDLSAAGFEGKTLAEVFREIKDSVCGTATDTEVEEMLNGAFSHPADPSENPNGESFSDTAADKEVADILNDVFGK